MQNPSFPYEFVQFGHKARLSDRYLESLIHYVAWGQDQVGILVTIEIRNPWHPTGEYGQQIMSQIVREFSRGESQSILIRFEQALKQANRLIDQAKEKLETAIDCSVCLLANHEVHFSSIGRGALVLYRDGKISQITNPNESTGQFATVTSGDLDETDWLMSVNQEFAELLLSLPKTIWVEASSNQVSETITKATEPAKRQTLAGTLLRYQPVGVSRQQKIIIWDEAESFTPIRLPKFRWNPALLQKAGERLRQWFQAVANAVTHATRSFLSLFKGKSKLSSFHPRVRLSRNTAIIAVIFLALLGSGIFIFQKRFNHSQETGPKTIGLVEKIKASPSSELPTLLGSELTKGVLDGLSAQDKTDLTSYLQSKGIGLQTGSGLLSQLPKPVVAIDSSSDTLFLVDQSGQLWKWSNNSLTQLEQQTLIPSPIGLTVISPTNIVLSDQAGNLWQYDGTATGPVALVLPSAVPTGTKLVQRFDNNLYIYSATNHSVYRVTNFQKDASKAVLITKAETIPLGTLADWTITGQVIGLDTTGKVVDWRNNKLGSLTLQLPTTATTPRVDGHDPDLLLSNGNFLYHYQKSSLISSQFVILPSSISDISYQSNGQKIWLISGNSLFELSAS